MKLNDFGYGLHRVGGHDIHFEADAQDLRDDNYQYYSFVASEGAWVILRFDLTVTDVITYRYAFGKSNIPDMSLWPSQNYVTYNLVGK